MESLVNLKWASFNNNLLTRVEGLEKCKRLEELSLEGNLLQSLEGLENCDSLRKLNVNNNLIYYHEENTKRDISLLPVNWDLALPKLAYLSISYNRIRSLKFVSKLTALMELYVSFNKIRQLRDIFHLKSLNSLIILDLWSNDMCEEAKYRSFVIYNLRFLKSLDGFSIDQNEYMEAKETFGGKLTCDFIAEKFPSVRLNEIKNLEFPQCSIRLVDLGATPQLVADQFENLRALNLENNSLVSFSGLIYLRNLRVLCLNYNKIESVLPKAKSNPASQYEGQILPSLEILHLAYNGISDMVSLQVGRLNSLKALFLQGNELVKIDGLEGLRELRELVLDKNKIKSIGENSFVDQTQRLIELHIEENRLRDLNNIEVLQSLQKVYAANNKITEFADIEPLTELGNIQEISLINNPISRRPHYRISLVYRMKRMKILDLIEVTNEDQIRAEIYFNEQQQLMQQPQVYYSGMVQVPGAQLLGGAGPNNQPQLNTMNMNQFDHTQFLGLTQSPRVKPVNNFPAMTNPQLLANINQSMAGVVNINNVNNKVNKQNGKIIKK